MSKETAIQALKSLTDEEAELLNNSPDLLNRFKQKHGLLEPEKSGLRKFSEAVVKSPTLPIAGAVAGGTLGSGIASIPLAGLGAAGGESIRQLAARGLGMEAPKTSMEAAKKIGIQGIQGAADQALGMGVVKAGGSALKAIKPFIKGAGTQIESIAGAAPGSLEAAYKDKSLILAPGKKAVQSLYETAKESVGGGFRQSLKEIPDKKVFVDEAFKIAKEGKLTPAEALEARKMLDSVKRSVSGPYFEEVRGTLDKVAKVAFEKGDAAYKRAVHAESLRNLLPQNKYGGASAFKTAIITGLQGMAESGGIPKVVARTAGALMSPAAAGVAATGAGIASRAAAPLLSNPVIPAAALTLTLEKAKEFLKKAKGNRDKARKMAQEAGYVIPEVGK